MSESVKSVKLNLKTVFKENKPVAARSYVT